MPSKMMNQPGVTDFQFSGERQAGLMKTDPIWRGQYGMKPDGVSGIPFSMAVASSPLEKFIQLDCQSASSFDNVEPKVNFSLPRRHAVGAERAISRSLNLWGSVESSSETRSNSNVQLSWDKKNGSSHYENGLFSSSLSELFSRKLRLSTNDVYGHSVDAGHSVDTVASHFEEEEPFGSLEEIEAQTIGNLLPNDDELLSGVVDGHEHVQPSREDEMEDLDLFSSVGGMELGDDASSAGNKKPEFLGTSSGPLGGTSVSLTGEHSGERPSCTLFVRNIASNVEDSELQALFEQYGDIRTLYTAHKHRGFVMISYYDVRAACNALKALQNKPLRHKRIDIHYSIPKDNPSENDPGVGVNAGIRAAVAPFMQCSSRPWISASVPSGLSSVLRGESSWNQSGFSESANSLSQVKYDFQGPATLHPHSLPEYTNGIANIAPHASNTNLPANVSSLPLERVENPHLSRMNASPEMSNGFGLAGNACGPYGGHQYEWSNTSHPHSPSFLWRDSLSLVNGLCTPQAQPRVPGLARSPSHIFNSAIPVNRHYVGAGPAVNPSFWDRRNSYSGGSPEASAFHQGPFGGMRLSGNHLHQLDFASHNMFPKVGGNCIDLPISPRGVGLHSHPQRCVMYPTRGQLGVGGLFEPASERIRGRRRESSSIHNDNKKQYELDIERIRLGEDSRTTLMIKNIPNKYTSKMLMAAIDERHCGTYDFIYLPIDFKNKCNVGYAFINMVDPGHIISLYEAFNGKRWEKFNSEKVASLAYARIQGKAALIAHFQNSSLMNEDKRCRPILFHSDGPNAGDQVPFPMGVNIRSRAGRSKSSSDEDNHQENTPILASNEESRKGDTSGKELD